MDLRTDVELLRTDREHAEDAGSEVPGAVAAGAMGPVLGRLVDGPHGTLLREVTFVWRAAPGRWPLLYVNGFTDRSDPGSAVMHDAGHGLWWRTLMLPHDAAVTYRFIDCDPDENLPAWPELHRRGRADRDSKLPRVPHFAGGESSVLVLPGAPDWARWRVWGPDSDRWQPEDLGGGRRGRIRLGAETPRALLVLFDAEIWSRLPLGAALRADVDVVTVATGSIAERSADLTDPERAADLVERAVAAWGRARGLVATPRTVVAGQSLGGLAAASVFAARPDLADAAVVQSASLWWRRGDHASGPLGHTDADIPAHVLPAHAPGRRIAVQAGSHEGRAMAERAQRYADGLRESGAWVDHLTVRGGHDLAWWFPGLVRGLDAVLADL